MQNFIVLGIIPGTNFQTTFNFWLSVAACFCALLFLHRFIVMLRSLRLYLLARKIARTISSFDLVTI